MDSTAEISKNVLSWYSDMGVDEALDIEPGNWFERSAVPARTSAAPQAGRQTSPAHQPQYSPPQQAAPAQTSPRNFPMMSPDGAATEAREKAASAENLEELEKILRDFDGCSLKVTATLGRIDHQFCSLIKQRLKLIRICGIWCWPHMQLKRR